MKTINFPMDDVDYQMFMRLKQDLAKKRNIDINGVSWLEFFKSLAQEHVEKQQNKIVR